MTLKQRIHRIADELCLDLRHTYTRILVMAIAAREMEDERIAAMKETSFPSLSTDFSERK